MSYFIDDEGNVRPCGGGDTVQTLRYELAREREQREHLVALLRRMAEARWIFRTLISCLGEGDRQAIRAALDQDDGNHEDPTPAG